ncbi:MAG TPA: DUF4097 family beta strand repeat-containing protein [Terriglobales bacterium]|nr:DUF4097 family beta strand repeat-containing protein [Terriglobales bacterium]
MAIAAGLTALPSLAQTPPTAPANSDASHVVVPLSHPSQPATLRVSVLSGSIHVRAYNGNQVVIDAAPGAGGWSKARGWDNDDRTPAEAQGMHRLNSPAGLTAEEDNNVVRVSTSVMSGSQDLNIQVPANTSVSLHTVNGSEIEVTGLTGDISCEATNGRITLNHVAGSVVAHALNGRIVATVDHLDAGKPSSFSSLNGTINVTLPADVRANLSLKTSRGDIYMDNGFQFQEQRQDRGTSGQRGDNGMYKVEVDRTISGTLNGGGADLRMQTFNGDIYIHKGK